MKFSALNADINVQVSTFYDQGGLSIKKGYTFSACQMVAKPCIPINSSLH